MRNAKYRDIYGQMQELISKSEELLYALERDKDVSEKKWWLDQRAQKAEIERLQSEIDCEERRFNDLSDMYAALSKKCDKFRAIIEELNECSAYWNDWEIPIGLQDRLKEALKDDN